MKKLTIVCVGGLLAAAPTAADGSTTGGGAYTSPAASIATVECRMGCVDRRTAKPGSYLRLKGQGMRRVGTVTFLGGPGDADDVAVPVAQATPRSVVVKVPEDARPGRLRARNGDGAQSRPSTVTIAIAGAEASADSAEPPETATPPVADRDTSDRIDAHVDTATVFFAGQRKATLRYTVTGDAPLELGVELVRTSDGASIQRWSPGAVAPGAEQRVDWDGTAGGKVVPEGRYEFRVFPLAAAAATAGDAPLVADSFRFLDHKFPVRGRHDFGGDQAVFGAGRTGRAHQGQDVFAACGTPLVAARGGKVRWKETHSRAGNYLVVDGDGTDTDYAYMHLQAPALVDKGDRVVTGQRIGAVGDTGAASGCHLHFELWSGPGWYEGGKPMDPLPFLRAWDAQSGDVTPLRRRATAG